MAIIILLVPKRKRLPQKVWTALITSVYKKIKPVQNHLPAMPFPQEQNPNVTSCGSVLIMSEQITPQFSFAWPV